MPAAALGNGGWIGVDLDGTLAIYEGWEGADKIGPPVPAMQERVVRWLAAGWDVRIFTARVSRPDLEDFEEVVAAIQAWSQEHLGAILEVTCRKDYAMVELWDDRAVQVEPNTGVMYGPSRGAAEFA